MNSNFSITEIGKVNKTPESLCEFEWRIPGFYSLSENSYFSPYFSFDDASWNLLIIPNGDKESNTFGFAKLCLLKTSGVLPINLEVSFSLQTSAGQKILNRQARRQTIHNYDIIEIYGTYLDLSRTELLERQSELLPSNILTVICTLKYSKSVEGESASCMSEPSIKPQDSKVLYDFKQLFLNEKYSDIIIRVKGQDFPAHKAILVARSPVFASVFLSHKKKKRENIVKIEDCSPSFFSDFLCFLYCGDIELITQENVFSLFTAADKYDVQDLKANCVEFMKQNLTINSFCDTITLALNYSITELIELTINFFTKNAPKIIVTVEWQSFVVNNLDLFKLK